MKYFIISFLCLSLIICLCSWVDPNTVDTYDGYLTIVNSSGYNVSNLSGPCEFYLDQYRNLGYDSDGYIFNATPNYYNGLALINGQQYSCRMAPNAGFQIQQTYFQNNYERTVWVDYDLYVDELPTGFSFIEFAIIIIVVVIFLLVAINLLMRGFIL